MAFTPADFAYDLPAERIAQRPVEPRDGCRLMHLRRATGELSHWKFSDLPRLLRRGDLLVLNDTRVVPAKFEAWRPAGGRVEGLFLHEEPGGTWTVLLKNAGRCKILEKIDLRCEPPAGFVLESRSAEVKGQWTVRPEPPAPARELLDRIGSTPLPPYIRRPGPLAPAEDRESYQTVYARSPGAVAAPTAGLHFTPALFDELATNDVETSYVTLHVGLGTFLPVEAATLAEHRMHSEWFSLPAETARKVLAVKGEGRRVVAVGTTAVRVLESVGGRAGSLAAQSGWTDIFLYPPAEFAVTDALITNFHLPCSTLIMLAAAFCSPGGLGGREMILDAYREAIREGYRFYSYGDAMLID